MIGATLLSAAGSLPLHLAPVLVATVLASRPVTNAQAASLISCIMAGQIAAVLVSTRIRIERINRLAVIGTFAVFFASTLSTPWIDNQLLFNLAWFVAGLVCGLLMQFGIVTAANSRLKLQAFAYRLSFALFFSGVVSSGVLLFGKRPEYGQLIALLGSVMCFIFLVGVTIWKRDGSSDAPSTSARHVGVTPVDLAGLGLLLLFFAGQTGFLSNAAHFTSQNSVSLGDTAAALGISKIAISFVIFAIAIRGSGNSWRQQMVYALFLCGAVILISLQQDFAWIVVGFIIFELCLNLSSAAFMASLSEAFTLKAKNLLLMAILLGVLSGPPLAGHLIDEGLNIVPILLALMTAFLPIVWSFYLARAGKNKPAASHAR